MMTPIRYEAFKNPGQIRLGVDYNGHACGAWHTENKHVELFFHHGWNKYAVSVEKNNKGWTGQTFGSYTFEQATKLFYEESTQ